MKKKVILHIPHSSVFIPNYNGFVVSGSEITQEVLKMTDWFTEDLFFSEEDEMIIADFSRIFCDAERFSDDTMEVMSKYGMGVLYYKSDDGFFIRDITKELRDEVLNNYYWKHHEKLRDSVNAQLKHYQKALIIDCHSFPNLPMQRDLDKRTPRPDFNIGTDSFHTPNHLIDIAKNYFNKFGYSLGVDWPYQGSIVPLEFYQKNKNVYTIMLEVNRKLYLKENTNEKSDSYNEIKRITSGFIMELKKYF